MKKTNGALRARRIDKVLFAFIIIISSAIMLSACTGFPIQWKWGNNTQPCTICEEMNVKYPDNMSLICARVPNPCVAQDLLVTFAKAGVIWEAWKIDEFEAWTAKTRSVIKNGLSYKALNDYVMRYIVQFNKKMGATYLLISDLLIDFRDEAMIDPADAEMLLMALDRLDAEVEAFRPFE